MLVSLESEDWIMLTLYADEEGEPYLIAPDKQIFVDLDEKEDFLQNVQGWDEVTKINYLNGDVNSDFRDKVNLSTSALTKADVEYGP